MRIRVSVVRLYFYAQTIRAIVFAPLHRKTKELKNLPKQAASNHPKAEFLEWEMVCNAILLNVHNSVANRTENSSYRCKESYLSG